MRADNLDLFPEAIPPKPATMREVFLLEPILQQVEALIGLTATLALVQAFGGTKLYIPKRVLLEDNPLVQSVGMAAAVVLQTEFGGQHDLVIPKAEAFMRHRQDREIRRLRQTLTIGELARRFNLHERTIRKVLARAD